MKKLLSIALLLFSIAAPSATYSDEAPRNIEKISASVETQKADNIKPATSARRFGAFVLSGTMSFVMLIIFRGIYSDIPNNKLIEELQCKWSYMVITYITSFLFDLFSRYILGMKVVDTSGKDASWVQLLIRYIVEVPPIAFIPPFFSGNPENRRKAVAVYNLLGWLWTIIQGIVVLVKKDGRGPADLLVKTVVVMRDKSTSDSNKSTLA